MPRKPAISSPLAGRGAVVVGGTRGIGLSVAQLLAAQGAGVVVSGRDATAAGAAAEQVSGLAHAGSFAFLGDYGGTGYPAGKGAVNALTLAIAAELREHGVRANVVCPGARTRLSTGSDYQQHIADLNRRGLLDDVSMQGALDAAPPEYVAPMYGYLVGDAARNVTGRVFIAAGGFLGEFARPAPDFIGYRDHHNRLPYTVDEVHGLIQET